MSPKRTYERGRETQESCVYAVPVFNGISDEGRLVIDKDDWREPSDPHAWLVRVSGSLDGELVDREIIVVHYDAQSGAMWMQLAPDDNAYNRHDYITGRFDENFQLQGVVVRRGRYEEHDVTSVEELDRLRNNVISIGKYVTAGAVAAAA